MVQGEKVMYLHVNSAFKFHRDASGGRLSINLQNTRESEELNGYAADSRGGFMSMAYFAIDGFYVDFLSFADGTVTLEELVARYVKDSDPVFGPVWQIELSTGHFQCVDCFAGPSSHCRPHGLRKSRAGVTLIIRNMR